MPLKLSARSVSEREFFKKKSNYETICGSDANSALPTANFCFL